MTTKAPAIQPGPDTDISRSVWLRDWVPTPKYAAGEPVAHCYHGRNDDELSPKQWHCMWYRGIVLGCYYNKADKPKAPWRIEGWVYIVELESGSDGSTMNSWPDITEEFPEGDLHRSYRGNDSVAPTKCN